MATNGLCEARLSTAVYASECCMFVFVHDSECLCCDCLCMISCAVTVYHVPRFLCCVVTVCAYVSDCLRSACTLNDCALIVRVQIAVVW